MLFGCSLTSAKPDLDYGLIRSKMYDSVFSIRNSKGSGGTQFDEYVVYESNQAIPRYVVYYKNLECNALELQTIFQNKANLEFERRTLDASPSPSSFKGVTSDELHFRFAEAQFLRMSNNKQHKVSQLPITSLKTPSHYFSDYDNIMGFLRGRTTNLVRHGGELAIHSPPPYLTRIV